MLRTALRPAWLALLALLIGIVIAFYHLGMWQLGVSSNDAAREFAAKQAARPTEVLTEVMQPHQVFPADGAGLSVTMSGTYVPQEQFLVPNRLLDGEPGYWVITPLQVDPAPGSDAEAGWLPVVRGFVTAPEQAELPTTGHVSLAGTMAPAESPVPAPDEGWPAGQRGSIDTADLANVWPAPIYSAFIFLVTEEPGLTDSSVIQRIPPPVFGETGIVWRNVGYALQWFVFAAFAVYMYWRFLRQATQAREAEADDLDHPEAGPDPESDPGPGSGPAADELATPHTRIRQGETV